jgi:hypothetical protein
LSVLELFDPMSWMPKWDEWLQTRGASRFFGFCTAGLLVATIFSYLAGAGFTPYMFHSGLYWVAEIFEDALGAIWAFGAISLWLGMWRFWVRLDKSSSGMKKFWFFLLFFGVWYGAAAYYFAIYRPQISRVRNLMA